MSQTSEINNLSLPTNSITYRGNGFGVDNDSQSLLTSLKLWLYICNPSTFLYGSTSTVIYIYILAVMHFLSFSFSPLLTYSFSLSLSLTHSITPPSFSPSSSSSEQFWFTFKVPVEYWLDVINYLPPLNFRPSTHGRKDY